MQIISLLLFSCLALAAETTIPAQGKDALLKQLYSEGKKSHRGDKKGLAALIKNQVVIASNQDPSAPHEELPIVDPSSVPKELVFPSASPSIPGQVEPEPSASPSMPEGVSELNFEKPARH